MDRQNLQCKILFPW